MPESPQLCLLAAGSPFAFTEVHDTIFYFWVADMRVDITMNTGLEVRKIHLRVTLKKITMNIKFPCSLTAQIKHGKQFTYLRHHTRLQKTLRTQKRRMLHDRSPRV